jgi:hypothetical protein
METIKARKLVHSGNKRSYPSSFLWDCINCKSWNIWKTKRLWGKVEVCCSECRQNYLLDKIEPLEVITRKKHDGSIID